MTITVKPLASVTFSGDRALILKQMPELVAEGLWIPSNTSSNQAAPVRVTEAFVELVGLWVVRPLLRNGGVWNQ